MKKSALTVCLLISILHTGNSSTYAQETFNKSKEQFGWVNAGVGTGSAGLSGSINMSYQIEKNLISIRSIYSVEFNIFGPSPSETVWDVGALYGRSAKGSYGLASISGGVAIVGGVRRGRYLSRGDGWFSGDRHEELTFTTVGFPIEGQLFWTPIIFLGIGFYGFANINPEKSFAGALLCVQIGNLR